jgi:DNA polymerase-3 subunit alpha (Gram-positive type)
MKKYCIIPSAGDMLWQVMKDQPLDFSQKKQIRSCRVLHVEVDPAANQWEVVLQTPVLLSQKVLDTAAEMMKSDCGVQSIIFLQNIVDLEQSLQNSWKRLCQNASVRHPILENILLQASFQVQGNRVILELQGDFCKELIEAYHADKSFEKAIFESLGYSCQVECRFLEEKKTSADSLEQENEALNTPEYRRALRLEQKAIQEKAHKASSYAAVASAEEKKTEKPNRNVLQKRKPSAAENTIKISAAGPVIYGRPFSGPAKCIDDLDGEEKNVILEGFIGEGAGAGIHINEFKTGTKLVSFSLTDKTNGICCKLFLSRRKGRKEDKLEEEFERIKSLLKEGMHVRVHGNISFDQYLNEYALRVDSVAEKKLPQREDHAEVKRVELHAHTTMSAMDAVDSVTDLVKTADRWGWPAIAITDHGVVQAFPDAAKALASCKTDLKVIYGMEGYLVGSDYKQKKANHIIFLAKTPNGLRNLYQMVSLSHLKFFHRQPRLPKKIIEEFREGILIGSACEAGELIRAIEEHQSDAQLMEIASFYDYLEIQPIHNNDFLKRSDNFPDIQTDDDLRAINLKVADIAQKLHKPLVATCDVHFLNPEDNIYRAIIMKGKGFDDAELQPPLYLRTTEEMLAEFSYLGEKLAYEAVVENPRKIAESIERFKPIPDDLYSPQIPGADKEIRDMSYRKARELYGENLPKIVEDRLEQELKPIIAHGFSVLYLIAQRLVKKSNDDGYLVGSRGSVGSSFIATMTGITEVNPLPPHWRCPCCQYSQFVTDGSYGCGFDLPDRVCPVCGTPLKKDGHDIPFAVFLGFDGDKVPDIDLNFSGTYQPVAHKYTEILFGKDNVYRAGSIQTVADKTAFGYVKKFFEEKGVKKHISYIDHLAKGCMGVKSTTGQHPAGIMVVPRNMDVHFFTPIQHPANDMECGTITTHFDYHSISSRLVKLDILGHDDPTVIKMLEDLTHRDPKTIPFDDKATTALFNSTVPLGLTPEELGATSGTFGIPEFRTPFTRQMIDDTHPDVFSDLVRISGFSHGTDVWLGNAQDLIRGGQCTIKNAISARDDIMMYLIHHGIDPLLSFKTMEKVRKGRGIQPDVVEKLRKGGIPEWFIESCQKIKYLFPRAHATAYVMMAYRIAFCKVHYPLAYYAAYFSIRAAEFDADVVARGKDFVGNRIKEYEQMEKEKGKLDQKQNATLVVLQLAWEMYLRGYSVEYVDLYHSAADKFIIHEKSLLPPISSLAGMGQKAAESIVEARKDGIFTSVDNLRTRTGISKTNIEILRHHGCLDGWSESDQIALFS